MIKERIDKTTDVMESILFTNIIQQHIWKHTPKDELKELKRIISEQNLIPLNNLYSTVKIDKMLIKSVINN